MLEREKVIKAIEICYSEKHNCTECELFYVEDCNDKLMRDVLELLKEQPEIVRCKDCEYYMGGVLSGYCDRWFRQTGGEETYCSEGRQVVKQK